MSQKQLFDAELFKTKNLMELQIRHINSKNTPVSKKIPVYKDDSCKDVLLKLSSFHSNCISDHIFAWYKVGSHIVPLGFVYPSLELNDPYKGNKKPDERFLKNGNRILVLADKTHVYNLIQNYPIKTLFYTTIYDYLEYLNLPKNKLITDELCQEKTSYSTSDIYNGILVKYWPSLTMQQVFHVNGTTDPAKLKLEDTIVKQMLQQVDAVYSMNQLIIPEQIDIQLLAITNNDTDNIVHLSRLFSDISVGQDIIEDIELPFSKITLDDYTSKYCKLLKDSIVISSMDKQHYVTKELFSTWFKNQITTLPSTVLKFMDESNTVIFKFQKDSKILTLVIHANGSIQLLFSGSSLYITNDYIVESIRSMNHFIEYLNSKRVFSDKLLQEMDVNYQNFIELTTSQFIYPIKNYKRDIFIQMLKNMSLFVRYNKHQDTKIVAIFKRVDQYGQSIASVISSLHRSKRKLTREQIISELEVLFNISNDEAIDEYDNWETDPTSRFFKGGEEGVELIFDLIGTNVKVDIIGSKSYEMMSRIYQTLNFMITYYETFLTSKKDPLNLMKKSSDISLAEQVAAEDIEQELRVNEQLEAIIESEPNLIEVLNESPDDTVVVDQQSQESRIQEIVDDAGSNSEERSRQLSLSQSSAALDLDSSSELVDSSSGSDISVGPIDESEGGGSYKRKQRGGYNVNRYYLNRLQKYDNEMFRNHKSIPRKNQFAVKCHTTADRQPVPVTKKDLDRYEQSGEGEGVSYSEALNIPGRDPNIFYICPKYWDVKDERPRDPLKKEEFKDVIVDNKMTTGQKKNTDNYVLVRDESGYWREAGDNIERYTIKLMKGSHPDGYELPCCNAPRKGAIRFPNGDVVEVLIKKRGKYKWIEATVVSSTKKTVTVSVSGSIQTFPTGSIRKPRVKNRLSDIFPLDIDVYGHIDKRIKQMIQQPLDYPEYISGHNGCVRKGVFRSSSHGDQSFLESIAEILDETNKSSIELRKNIIDDLFTIHKHNVNIILSIADGGFVNKFKMDVIDFKPTQRFKFLKYVKEKYPFVDTNIKFIQGGRKKNKLRRLTPEELFAKFLHGGSPKQRLIINNEINIYSAILQFEKYINDKNELVMDEFVIPVISKIARYPSKTFKYQYKHLAIVVFENINEDIIVSPPIGGFPNKMDALILLYKERRTMYEPILYKKYEQSDTGRKNPTKTESYCGVLRVFDETHEMYDQNPQIKAIMDSVHEKMNHFTNEVNMHPTYPSKIEIESYLHKLDIPIVSYVYDNYCKVIYIQIHNNILIPITPCGIEEHMKLVYISSLVNSDLPTYDDVIGFLGTIEKELTMNYLDEYSISVVNDGPSSAPLNVKEIILKDNVYIPIKSEVYDRNKFKINVSINESYTMVDRYLGLIDTFEDERTVYLKKQQYTNMIHSLLFQKVYLELKDKSRLLQSVHKIKYHPIKLRQHKSEEIFDLLDPIIKSKLVILDETPTRDYEVQELSRKLVIQSIDEVSAEKVYYKLVKLMIECLLNYSEQDYERFLQLDINLTKLKSSLKTNELIFSYRDIVNDNHLEYFVRYSRFIRNYIAHDEPVQKSKLIQVHRLKEKTKKEITGDFSKQYPQIVHKLFGRKVNMLNYKLSTYSVTEVIHRILIELFENEEITEELINSLLQGEISQESLDRLTSYTMFQTIGFYVIHKPVEKLTHDKYVSYYRKIETNTAIVLYQTNEALAHIKKRDGQFTIKDLP